MPTKKASIFGGHPRKMPLIFIDEWAANVLE
jgi:hypothetical protein